MRPTLRGFFQRGGRGRPPDVRGREGSRGGGSLRTCDSVRGDHSVLTSVATAMPRSGGLAGSATSLEGLREQAPTARRRAGVAATGGTRSGAWRPGGWRGPRGQVFGRRARVRHCWRAEQDVDSRSPGTCARAEPSHHGPQSRYFRPWAPGQAATMPVPDLKAAAELSLDAMAAMAIQALEKHRPGREYSVHDVQASPLRDATSGARVDPVRPPAGPSPPLSRVSRAPGPLPSCDPPRSSPSSRYRASTSKASAARPWRGRSWTRCCRPRPRGTRARRPGPGPRAGSSSSARRSRR